MSVRGSELGAPDFARAVALAREARANSSAFTAQTSTAHWFRGRNTAGVTLALTGFLLISTEGLHATRPSASLEDAKDFPFAQTREVDGMRAQIGIGGALVVATVLTAGITSSGLAGGKVPAGWMEIANSATQFSGTQGQDGWSYRFDRGATTVVEAMPYYGVMGDGSGFFVWGNTASPAGNSYCFIMGARMHANAPTNCSGASSGWGRPRLLWNTPTEIPAHINLQVESYNPTAHDFRLDFLANGKLIYSATDDAIGEAGTTYTVDVANLSSLELLVDPLSDGCHADALGYSIQVLTPDCNANLIPDAIEIANGSASDSNADGIPDCCVSQIGCDGEYDVPSEFATVQLAINAAPATGGAIVKLAAGTYTAGFSLNGKDLIVRGDGAATTIIDGATATGSVVTFPGGEPATAGIEGLTIRNGQVGSPQNPPFSMVLVGGGLKTFNSNAFVHNCIFENCRAVFGGAIYAYGGSMDIDGCTFRLNQAQTDGGGVMVFRCDTLVMSSLFESNLCGGTGGGMGSAFKAVGGRVPGGLTTMQDCIVRLNSATTNGPAIEWFEDVSGVPGVFRLIDCTVTENSSPVGAGGLRVTSLGSVSASVLLDSILCDNEQSNVSGPVSVQGTTEICDCLADLNPDGVVTAADLAILLGQWGGGAGSSGDLNHDGLVSAADLALLLGSWGACP